MTEELVIREISWLVGWLVVFNVPSTARSFRDGTPIYCPLRRTRSSINTPFRPGIEPRAVAWQSITLPLRYASFREIRIDEAAGRGDSDSRMTSFEVIMPLKLQSTKILIYSI